MNNVNVNQTNLTDKEVKMDKTFIVSISFYKYFLKKFLDKRSIEHTIGWNSQMADYKTVVVKNITEEQSNDILNYCKNPNKFTETNQYKKEAPLPR